MSDLGDVRNEVRSGEVRNYGALEVKNGDVECVGGGEVRGVVGEASKFALLRKVWFNEFIVFLLFFSTLLLWPPLVTEIKSFNFPSLQESQESQESQ
ncbi:hypothetical protein B484DRAFT_411503, partial [Ochromonadaceae sp. CCMP2298]